MLEAWGRFVHRRRWAVLAVSVVSAGLSLWSMSHGGRPGDMLVPHETESGRALELMHHELRARPPTFHLLFWHPSLPVSDPAVRAEVLRALAPLGKDPRVAAIRTAWDDSLDAERISPDGRYTRVSVELHGRGSAVESMVFAAEGADVFAALRPLVRSDLLSVVATGSLALHHDFMETTRRDVRRAEMVILPVVPALLLLVFGSVVAAALPFGVGLLAVAAGLAATGLLAHVTSVSVYAINVVTMIGLAVAIDYSLFLVSRFREEIRQHAGAEALARTLATAGMSIIFSGLTVAVGLLGLYALRLGNLGSIGLAGTAVVFFAVLYSLSFLPALLAVLGPRVDAWPIPALLRRRRGARGFWTRLTTSIMAHPWKVLVPAVAGLLVLGAPFLRIRLAASDIGLLPPHAESRRGEELLKRAFPGLTTNRVLVVLDYEQGSPLAASRIGELYDYSHRLAADPAVSRVDSFVSLHGSITRQQYQALAVLPTGARPAEVDTALAYTMGQHIAILALHTPHAAVSDAARALVRRLRAEPRVGDAHVLVTGHTAFDLDFTDAVLTHAPLAVGIIVVVTYLALFLLLGSLLLPLKAVIMNFLSLTASYGAMVWIFQDGHLARWLHFTPGPIESGTPLIMFCVAFGLSMDYGVLLLTRIQEEYGHRPDNAAAVSAGLEHTGRIITAAAAIMAAVFGSFALADLVIVKAIGIGLGIAVLVDATVVRMLLVPATMRLLGRWNWWAPAPLTRCCLPRPWGRARMT